MDELGRIIERLVPELGEPGGDPQPLEGGITNRNFRVALGGKDYVIRVPGKETGLLGIDRVAERFSNERAAELGIAPPVAAALEDPLCLVTVFVEGKEMSPEDLREQDAIALVATALRRLHGPEKPLPTSFDTFTLVEEYAEIATQRGGELPPDYHEALSQSRGIGAALGGSEHVPVPCHNDLLAANFIRDGDRMWVLDWDYAGMGDRYFDLANFSINNGLDEDGQRALLSAYYGAEEPAVAFADLRLFLYMSDFREAMWGVVQKAISELDFDFDEYATKHFTRMRETAADPRFAGWIEEAGAAQR